MDLGIWQEAKWACAAMVTPVDGSGRIDAGRLAGYGRTLLARGINGLVPFGTMGEGPAFGVAERLEATARLVELGLPADRLILGIGASATSDMVWLGRKAGELGIAGVLATPPFFFRDVDQEGVHAFYAGLADGLGAAAPPLMLYHIPQVCGVPVAVPTVERLVAGFPGRIAGIKDSAADLPYTRALLAAVGSRTTVVVGCEAHLPEVMPLGARGTICGLANLIPRSIAGLVGGDAARLDDVAACGRLLQGVPVIPTVKAAVGTGLGDPAWAACMAPLRAVSGESAAALAAVTQLGD